jgi:hypothetical protein
VLPFEGSSIPVRRCSCSFCTKHGAVYTSHPEGSLRAVIRGPVTTYCFATRTAQFYVCSSCGVVAFVTSEIEGSLRAVVNVNTLQGIEIDRFDEHTTRFDGESRQARLDRRARTWISTVCVKDQGSRS